MPSGPPQFDLVAVDLWRVDQPIPNVAAQPTNRVQRALGHGDRTWVFVLQIQIPGPPHFAFAAYYVPRDPTCLAADSPFGRVAQPFFFGPDDDFRDSRFKLIPKVPRQGRRHCRLTARSVLCSASCHCCGKCASQDTQVRRRLKRRFDSGGYHVQTPLTLPLPRPLATTPDCCPWPSTACTPGR